MIEKIEVNFSFGNLLKKLDNILEENMFARKKIVIESAKDIINSGKLRKNKKSTLLLKGQGLKRKNKSGFITRIHSPKNPKEVSTGETRPLIHTGTLRASFKIVDDGIRMAKHGVYHLSDYTLASNEFTRKFFKKAIGKTIKARNFLPITAKGNFKANIKKQMKKIDEDLYKGIRRAMKRKV